MLKIMEFKRQECCNFINSVGHAIPVTAPLGCLATPGIPLTVRRKATFGHKGEVFAVTFTNSCKHLFTAGLGSVKIWDIGNMERGSHLRPVETINRFKKTSQIKAIRLLEGDRTFVVAEKSGLISMWDCNSFATPWIIAALPLHTISPYACHNLVIGPDSRVCFSAGSDGKIHVRDLHNHLVIKSFKAHDYATTCLEVSNTGDLLWSTGLDGGVRAWDVRNLRQILEFKVGYAVYSVACSPMDHWKAYGCSNGQIDVQHCVTLQKYQLFLHEGEVTALKYAESGQWFVSTGNDRQVNAWMMPFGANIFQLQESHSVRSCDIAANNRLIATGSHNKASLYEVFY